MVAPQGVANVARLAAAVEDPETRLPEAVRELGRVLLEQIETPGGRIKELKAKILERARESEEAKRLMAIPGGCLLDFFDLRGGAASRPDQLFKCCRKRRLSFPVSTISQWCAGRSSRDAVTFPSPNTCGHAENDRLIATITGGRS